jgi:hypothetical protein
MPSIAQSYDLGLVADIAQFSGSDAAHELLRKNGFVVADPAFKQIFEPYIKSPMTHEPSGENPRGLTLPSFITVDSAWHCRLARLAATPPHFCLGRRARCLRRPRQAVGAISRGGQGLRPVIAGWDARRLGRNPFLEAQPFSAIGLSLTFGQTAGHRKRLG